jgi:hypothetical protein
MPEPTYHFPIPGHKEKVGLHHGADNGGSDLFAPEGTPVVAMVDGVVVDVGASGPGGNSLTIKGSDGRQYYYAHLREPPAVRAGQKIRAGQRVGSVGETGNARGTGAHLHIGIGPEIQSGVGPKGGTGRGFDAVSFLSSVQETERAGGPKVQARVAAQEVDVDETTGNLALLKQTAQKLRNRVTELSTPIPKPAPKLDPKTGQPDLYAEDDDLDAWKLAEEERKANLATARSDLRETESDLDTLEREQRAAAARAPAQQATGARADERLDLSAEARAEASARAGAADVQRGRELRRAGEYAWGPDGVPYGIYDDDGKLRLLSDKEQTRAIALVRQGVIKRRREVPGSAEYPGQTPETTTIEETATLPAGLGTTDAPKMIEIGRSVYQVQPDGTLKKVHEEPRDPPQQTPRQERFPEEIQRDKQQVEEGELTIEKKRRDLLGPATVALQNHIALIDQVEKMVATGQLKPEQASQYVATSEQNYQAALRGTTVAAEQEAVKEEARARRKVGADLIQQRISSGSSLAAALTSSAFGSGVMMPKGQTSLNYSPNAVAMQMTEDLSGPGVGDFARSLLMESGMEPMGGAMPGPSPWLPQEMPVPPRRMMPA